MKTANILRADRRILLPGFVSLLMAASLTSGFAQNILPVNPFGTNLEVRRPGADGVLTVTTDLLTPTQASGSTTGTNIAITNRAKGLVETTASVNIPLTSIPLVTADVDLYAYTATRNNTLVFGRAVEATASIGNLVDLNLGPTVGTLAGTSVANSWSSSITVSGLNLIAGNQYTVSFDALSGAGLPVNALTALNFGVANNGNAISSINNTTVLNLLDTITLGNALDTSNYSLTFLATQNMSELTFNFDGAAIVAENALGGIANNQNVVTFSGLAVAPVPVPEPGSASLVMAAGIMLLIRRRSRLPKATV